jgi:hypothetical protein
MKAQSDQERSPAYSQAYLQLNQDLYYQHHPSSQIIFSATKVIYDSSEPYQFKSFNICASIKNTDSLAAGIYPRIEARQVRQLNEPTS